MTTDRPIRVLIAKPGLDGHDQGAKVVVRALMDAGFEVIYTGLRQPVEAIVKAALEEDVDVIGLSIMTGAHLPLCEKLGQRFKEEGLDEKLWLVGGNIPARDRPRLIELGVDQVFATGSDFDDMVRYIRENCS
jgi:methylmalonyl-CoA mutase C-terminal domain/subunit